PRHAGSSDTGDDVADAACAIETFEYLPAVAAFAGPAARGQGVSAHVEADRNGIAVFADDAFRPLRVFERRRAEIDPAGAGLERALERSVVANAPRQLHVEIDLAHDPGEKLGVGSATECSGDVDEGNPLRTGL